MHILGDQVRKIVALPKFPTQHRLLCLSWTGPCDFMKDNLVILIPLPPEAEWNNQGIGRTVETISCELLENNDNLSITFLVAAHCGEQIRNSLRLSKYAGLYTVYELKSLYSIIGKLFHFKRDRKR